MADRSVEPSTHFGLNKDPVMMCKLPIFGIVFLKFLYSFPQMFFTPNLLASRKASKQQPKKLERGEMRERKTQ
jgi:hypothetical protein